MGTGRSGAGKASFRTWTVSIGIGELDGRTHATAHLHTDGQMELTGIGTAYLRPQDRDLPQIGDELAVSRALSDLAHVLVENAATHVAETMRTQNGYENVR